LSSVARFLFVSLCSDIFSSFFGGGFGVQIQTHWGRVRHSHSGKAKGWDECSLALLISVFCGLVCFQAQGGRGRGKPTRTPDVQHQVGLTLQDFYRGRTKKLKGQRGMRRAQWVAAAQRWKLHVRMRYPSTPFSLALFLVLMTSPVLLFFSATASSVRDLQGQGQSEGGRRAEVHGMVSHHTARVMLLPNRGGRLVQPSLM